MWNDGQIGQITRVLVFWTFLVESRNLAYPKEVIRKQFIKRLENSYGIAHAMTQMHASIPKSDSSKRSGKPDPQFVQNHECVSEQVRTTSAFLLRYPRDFLQHAEDVQP